MQQLSLDSQHGSLTMSERSGRSLHLPRPRWPHRSKDRNSPSPNPTSRETSRGTSEGRLQPSPSSSTQDSGLIASGTVAFQNHPPVALEVIPSASNSQIHQIVESGDHISTMNMPASPARELWDEALERLRLENQALVTVYGNVLKRASGVPDSGTLNEQMEAVINSRLQEMRSKQWKIRLGNTDITIRDQIDRIVGVVLAIRDVGDHIVALNPVHAGIPWAGVCVLLSVVVNDSVAQATARAGLEKLAVIVPRYKQVESLYLSHAEESEVTRQLRNAIVGLYANILSYQIELARHMMHHAFIQFAKAALQLDDWNEKLRNIQDSDEQCKNIMALCDARLAAEALRTLHEKLSQLDDGINQRIADILTSQRVVGWDPGPSTDPGYVAVLYGSFQAKQGFYRISLAGVDTDRRLFVMLRQGYAKRQHPIRVVLGWLTWYSVTRLEFVKYQTKKPFKAFYAHTGEKPLSQLLPMERRIHAWYYPDDMDPADHECLTELRAVLASPEQWGILIVEDFEVVKFSINMTINIGVSLLIQMATETLGRSMMGSIRSSFIGMFISVILFGVLAHPAMIDVVREILNKRRMYVLLSCLIAGGLADALKSMMSGSLRRVLTGFLSVALLAGLLY